VRLRLDHDQHGGTAWSSTQESGENPKSEFRNPKQARRLKKEKLKKGRKKMAGVFQPFEFRICFGFRYSDFEFSFSGFMPKKAKAPRPGWAHGAKN